MHFFLALGHIMFEKKMFCVILVFSGISGKAEHPNIMPPPRKTVKAKKYCRHDINAVIQSTCPTSSSSEGSEVLSESEFS